MQFILQTLLTAFPFILPILILLIAKKVGFRYKAQRPFFRAAFVFYGLALAAFALHAYSSGGVNWSTVTLFFMKPEKSKTPEPAAKEGEAADAQKAVPSSDADRQAGGSGQ